ncbi:MAG: WYL domain-containing protein [Planctomycetes bacterium]|nr:WYL domain-containing protein [Planctomycetota bacterium]
MQHSRLLAILLTLQTRGRVSAQALATTFEVSVRTIYRDIDALSAAGVPVHAETGRNGGFQLRHGYRTRLTGLDRTEAESLFLAGVPFAAAQLGLGPAVERTRMKLLAALSDDAAKDAERVAARFHLDPVAWFQAPEDQRLLPELAAAVWTGRRVAMRYASWKSVVERRATPLGLVLKSGVWYLVAAVDGKPRTYRVGSIEALRVEAELGAVPRRFDLARYWKEFAGDYERRMQSERAVVRARPDALRSLARMSQAMAEAVAKAAPVDRDGWHVLAIPIESIDVAASDLLRLGPSVEALEPAELRAALRCAVEALSAVYAREDGASPREKARGRRKR